MPSGGARGPREVLRQGEGTGSWRYDVWVGPRADHLRVTRGGWAPSVSAGHWGLVPGGFWPGPEIQRPAHPEVVTRKAPS